MKTDVNSLDLKKTVSLSGLSFSTGLLRSARNDVSGEGGKKEAVLAPLPTKDVIARSEAKKQSSASYLFQRNKAVFLPPWRHLPLGVIPPGVIPVLGFFVSLRAKIIKLGIQDKELKPKGLKVLKNNLISSE